MLEKLGDTVDAVERVDTRSHARAGGDHRDAVAGKHV
jgi:hypothetical protein